MIVGFLETFWPFYRQHRVEGDVRQILVQLYSLLRLLYLYMIYSLKKQAFSLSNAGQKLR